MPNEVLALPKVYSIDGKAKKIMVVYLVMSIISALAVLIQLGGLIIYHTVLISKTYIPIALFIYVCALVMAVISYLCATIYTQGRNVRLEVLAEGLAFYYIGFRMFTPWSNISGFDEIPLGRKLVPGLKYKEAAVAKLDVVAGIEQKKAVTRYNWWVGRGRRYFEGMPLTIASHYNFEQSELGRYIKKYAPQAFAKTGVGF